MSTRRIIGLLGLVVSLICGVVFALTHIDDFRNDNPSWVHIGDVRAPEGQKLQVKDGELTYLDPGASGGFAVLSPEKLFRRSIMFITVCSICFVVSLVLIVTGKTANGSREGSA